MKSAIGAVALIALAGPALAQTPGQEADPVVATIDGEQVHRSDVEALVSSLPEQYRQMPLPLIYDALLDRVIDFRLLTNEAERQNVGEDPEVQARLEQARADVLRDALIEQRIEAGTTDERLRERYETMKGAEDFAREEVHARHILLESEEEAKAVIEQLQGGADFAEVAQEKSTGPSAGTGGDLGYFAREEMVPPFAEAAFALEPGQITQAPVQTQFGWHVIEVLDKRTSEPSFEESAPQLRQDVAREIVTALLEDLRGDAEIERFNLDGTARAETPPEAGAAPQGEQPQPPAQQQ